MTISIIIIVISLFLDGILSNFLPYTVGNLSLFTPLFTVMSLFLVYPFFKKREKSKYIILIMITGLIYDLLYTNLLFFHFVLFFILGGLVMLLYKYFDTNYGMLLVDAVILVFFYQAFSSIFLVLFQVVPIPFSDFLYLVEHTLLINIIYLEVGFFIIRMLPKKYQGLSIN